MLRNIADKRNYDDGVAKLCFSVQIQTASKCVLPTFASLSLNPFTTLARAGCETGTNVIFSQDTMD